MFGVGLDIAFEMGALTGDEEEIAVGDCAREERWQFTRFSLRLLATTVVDLFAGAFLALCCHIRFTGERDGNRRRRCCRKHLSASVVHLLLSFMPVESLAEFMSGEICIFWSAE